MKATKRARTRQSVENRFHIRFNKAFPVVVLSELYGETGAVARNISEGGMFIEMADPLPLGSQVTVSFRAAGGGDLSARGEVKHHYCFNYGGGDGEMRISRGIGLRFLEFFPHGDRPLDALLTDPTALH
jgi:hypothetical protein